MENQEKSKVIDFNEAKKQIIAKGFENAEIESKNLETEKKNLQEKVKEFFKATKEKFANIKGRYDSAAKEINSLEARTLKQEMEENFKQHPELATRDQNHILELINQTTSIEELGAIESEFNNYISESDQEYSQWEESIQELEKTTEKIRFKNINIDQDIPSETSERLPPIFKMELEAQQRKSNEKIESQQKYLIEAGGKLEEFANRISASRGKVRENIIFQFNNLLNELNKSLETLNKYFSKNADISEGIKSFNDNIKKFEEYLNKVEK